MRLGRWWSEKSGKAKVVTVLATLLLLQIGLCFGTPAIVPWYQRIFGPSSDSEYGLGLMILQALLCFVTFILLIISAVLRLPGRSDGNGSKEDSDDR